MTIEQLHKQFEETDFGNHDSVKALLGAVIQGIESLSGAGSAKPAASSGRLTDFISRSAK